MKIYIDVTVLSLATFVTGIQRVTREICVRMIKQSDFDVFLIHYNAADNIFYRIDNDRFVKYYADHSGIKEKMITNMPISIYSIEKESVFFDLDAAWMSKLKRSYLLPILKKNGVKIIAHIYDIISITHPQYCLERGVYNFMDYIGAHMLYADTIIVNANATIDEIKKIAEHIECRMPKCYVIPLGADFKENSIVDKCEVSDDIVQATQKPYILMVGTLEPRKNHKLLLDAYDYKIKELGYNIVMAGYMGWNMDEFHSRLVTHPDYKKGIFHFEGLDDKGISYLYQNAEFLAFNSFTEGFGLPILEALHYGIKVIASDIPVSREVGGDRCIWYKLNDIEDFCKKIQDNETTQAVCRGGNELSAFCNTWDTSYSLIKGLLSQT